MALSSVLFVIDVFLLNRSPWWPPFLLEPHFVWPILFLFWNNTNLTLSSCPPFLRICCKNKLVLLLINCTWHPFCFYHAHNQTQHEWQTRGMEVHLSPMYHPCNILAYHLSMPQQEISEAGPTDFWLIIHEHLKRCCSSLKSHNLIYPVEVLW